MEKNKRTGQKRKERIRQEKRTQVQLSPPCSEQTEPKAKGSSDLLMKLFIIFMALLPTAVSESFLVPLTFESGSCLKQKKDGIVHLWHLGFLECCIVMVPQPCGSILTEIEQCLHRWARRHNWKKC